MEFYILNQYDYHTSTLTPPAIMTATIDPYLANQRVLPNIKLDIASRAIRRAAKSGSKRGKTTQPWKKDYAWSHKFLK